MLMVMLVRTINTEAGSSVFVFEDDIDGAVLGSYRTVSSAVLVGSNGHVIVEVFFTFSLAFAAASLFLISFLSQRSFRC